MTCGPRDGHGTPRTSRSTVARMTSTEPVRPCISADSHVVEPPEAYASIDPRFRDRAPRLVHDDNLGATMIFDEGNPGASLIPLAMVAAAGLPPEQISLQSGRHWEELHAGGHDPAARLVDQDRDGVVAEVLYPSVGMVLCNHPDLDYKKACFDAYNRWLAEFCAHAPERLVGCGQTPMRTPEEGIDDLARLRELGFRGAMLPGFPGVGDYDHPRYDPFWEAAIELGLPLSFHILTAKTGLGMNDFRGPKMNGFCGIIRANQDIIGTLIFGGVLERHPRLKVVCVEADAGWAPLYMYRMDHAFKQHGNWLEAAALSRLPSEYFRDNVYLTFQDDWVALRVLDLLNVDRLLWANDFPHSDATWPWSQEMLTDQTKDLTPHQIDRVLHDNCAELCGLTV